MIGALSPQPGIAVQQTLMTLRVYTANRRYTGSDRLDITLSQQDPFGRIFAPDAESFRLYRAKKDAGTVMLADWEAYRQAYLSHMSWSAAAYPEKWTALLARPQVTLVCFCHVAMFCHRSILAEVLVQKGATYAGERRLTMNRGDAFE